MKVAVEGGDSDFFRQKKKEFCPLNCLIGTSQSFASGVGIKDSLPGIAAGPS